MRASSRQAWRWRLLLASLAIGGLGWLLAERGCHHADAQGRAYFRNTTVAAGRELPLAEQEKPSGEGGNAALPLLTVLPHTGHFLPRVENAAAFIECGESLKDAQMVWFVELRDDALRQIVERPRETYDVAGQPVFIGAGQETAGPRAGRDFQPWDAARKAWAGPLRPPWFPQEAWADGNQVGWYRGGALYRGSSPDHFYWVKARL